MNDWLTKSLTFLKAGIILQQQLCVYIVNIVLLQKEIKCRDFFGVKVMALVQTKAYAVGTAMQPYLLTGLNHGCKT